MRTRDWVAARFAARSMEKSYLYLNYKQSKYRRYINFHGFRNTAWRKIVASRYALFLLRYRELILVALGGLAALSRAAP